MLPNLVGTVRSRSLAAILLTASLTYQTAGGPVTVTAEATLREQVYFVCCGQAVTTRDGVRHEPPWYYRGWRRVWCRMDNEIITGWGRAIDRDTVRMSDGQVVRVGPDGRAL